MGAEQGKWILGVRFKCRVQRRPDGFKDHAVLERLARGEETCPMEGREEEVRAASPADNVAGLAAAKKFPEPCSVCKKTPDWSDFDIL